MTELRDGDIVIHIPADPTQAGSGPYYVDNASDHDSGTSQVTVAAIWALEGRRLSLPWREVEVVGHYEVSGRRRTGPGFSTEAIQAMRPVIEKGRARLRELYPAIKARYEAEQAAPATGAPTSHLL